MDKHWLSYFGQVVDSKNTLKYVLFCNVTLSVNKAVYIVLESNTTHSPWGVALEILQVHSTGIHIVWIWLQDLLIWCWQDVCPIY